MKFVIQNKAQGQEVIAIFENEILAQEWLDYCLQRILVDPSKGVTSIIDAVEGKTLGDFL